MSTRACIAIKVKNGGYNFIYCHSDGYPFYTGRILLESYTDTEKVKTLISNGAMSVLGREVGDKHNFNEFGVEYITDGTYNVCTFYYRDRNDALSIGIAEDTKELFVKADEMCACFIYLFDNGSWKMAEYNKTITGKFKFKKMTKKDCKKR